MSSVHITDAQRTQYLRALKFAYSQVPVAVGRAAACVVPLCLVFSTTRLTPAQERYNEFRGWLVAALPALFPAVDPL